MVTHWITRVEDGENFWNSDRYSVWGITDAVHNTVKNLLKQETLYGL